MKLGSRNPTQQAALQPLSHKALSSSACEPWLLAPFLSRIGGLAELLVDDYAEVGFSWVKVLEIIEAGPIEGGSSIEVALGVNGMVACLE